MGKKGNLFALSLITALTGAGFAAGNKLYQRAVVPKARKEDEPDHSEYITEGRRFVREHPAHQDLYLEAIDLLKLHAVYIEAEKADSHRYVILVHGYNDNCESMGIYARHYGAQGYHLLLPDLRGYGKSEGAYVGFGLDDRMDLIEWIYWILRRDADAQIILHGVSMGAAAVLMTAGEHLPPAVKAVISDSAYSDLRDEFAHVLASDKDNVLPFPVAYTLLRAQTKARAGYDMNEVSPVSAVSRAEVPILFLHGEADRLIPATMATRLYEETASRKKLITFLGADHIRGIVTDPQKYWEQVDAFLKDAGVR